MIKERFQQMTEDPLLPQKVGFILGATLGVLLGLAVSAKADEYEAELELLEVENGETIED